MLADFEKLIKIATDEGVYAFRKAKLMFPQDTFYAICFYSDSDLRSIYPHANTLEALRGVDDRDDPNYFKWAPAEWQLDFGQYGNSEYMTATNQLLSQLSATSIDFGEYKRQAIIALSEALYRIRDSVFDGHAKDLAFWVNIGDCCGEEDWIFGPVIDHISPVIVEQLRSLFEFKVQRSVA